MSRLFSCALFLGFFLLGAHGAIASSQLYALTDPNDQTNVLEALAKDQRVDGLAIRTSWDQLQPTEAHFNWESIDQAFFVAQKYNKHITLHILSSGYGRAPAWVFESGAVSYQVQSPPFAPRQFTKNDAVPWDGLYLEKFFIFLKSLHAHLNERHFLPLLGYLSAATPVPEMSLVGCRDNQLGDQYYDRMKYLTAWRYSIDAYSAAFSDTPLLISAPVQTICYPDHDGEDFYRDVMTYALQKTSTHPVIYATDLTARGSERLMQARTHRGQTPVAFQMMGQSSHDPRNRMLGSLQQAICQGLSAGANYFEIYKVDLFNLTDTTIQNAISNLHADRSSQCQ
jgi:hypothetical protein